MLTVEDYGRIRRAHRDRLSIRAIAKKYHHSRRKVREALQNSEPRKYRRRQAPSAGRSKIKFCVVECSSNKKPSRVSRLGFTSRGNRFRWRAKRLPRSERYFCRLATQSVEVFWPSRSRSVLPVIVSPLSVPLYLVVNFWPLNSRVTEKLTLLSLKVPSEISVT